MEYTVIDKNGNDITTEVKVILNSTDNYMYCRMMADKILKKADEFFETEIMLRHKLITECKMEDFGEEFDPDRGQKWSNRVKEIYAEIEKAKLEYNEMMRIGGDWEDKEYAARWKKLADFLVVRSDNPLLEKHQLNESMSMYLKHIGATDMAKYIDLD